MEELEQLGIIPVDEVVGIKELLIFA